MPPFSLVCLLVTATLAAALARAEDDLRPRIAWKESWRDTYEANRDRWAKELEPQGKDDTERKRRLLVRMGVLCEAMAKRFPDEDNVVKRYGEVIDALVRLDADEAVRQLIGRLGTALPNRHDFAIAACGRVFKLSRWLHEGRHDVPAGQPLAEYAARKVLDLHKAGHVPDDSEAIVAAWKTLAILARRDNRLLKADAILGRIESLTDRDTWWLFERGLLDLAVGRLAEAKETFQRLADQTKDSHARQRLEHLQRVAPPRPPSFLSRFVLRNRWAKLRNRPLAENAEPLARLIADAARGESLIPWGDERHTSVWAAIHRALLARPTAELEPLRKAMAEDAADALRAARSAAADLLAVFRKYPWAPAAHEALLEYGEEALRNGQAGLALRAFRDALAHATDDALRKKAQAGLRLADPAGRKGASHTRSTPAPSKLRRQTLHAPVAQPWPIEVLDAIPYELLPYVPRPVPGLSVGRDLLVASAPRMLAGFGRDGRAAWTRSPSLFGGFGGQPPSTERRVLTIPGPFAAAVDGRRVFARWGLDPSGKHPTTVAAFDAGDGTMLWSTSAAPGWKRLWPVADPTVAEGRVYVLASRRGVSSVLPVAPVTLVCLDASDGSLLWKRLLGRQSLYLPAPNTMGLDKGDSVDLFHYGNAVTVRDGAVYCLTNAGFVARVDARDGVIDWAVPYARAHLGGNLRRAVKRQGAPPIVFGGRVVCVARDRFGAFALDAETGRSLWDSPYAPSNRVVGATDDLIVLADSQTAAALDAANGQVRWTRHFDEGIVGRASPPFTVATAEALHRLAPDSGKTLETLPWGSAGPLPTVRRGAALVSLAEQPLAGIGPAVGRPLNPRAPAGRSRVAATTPAFGGAPQTRSRPAGPLAALNANTPHAVLAQAWELVRPNPRLIVPPPEARLPDRLFLLSQRILECVAATPQGAVLWRRRVAPDLRTFAWADKRLLLIHRRRLSALDAATGQVKWETDTPVPIAQFRIASSLFLFGSFGRSRTKASGAIDLATGKLLWQHDFPSLGRDNWSSRFLHIAWDGRHAHFLAQLDRGDLKGYADIIVHPTEGRIVRARRWLRGGEPRAITSDRRFVFHVDERGALHRFGLDDKGELVRWPTDFGPLEWQGVPLFRLEGPWLQMQRPSRRSPTRQFFWVLRAEDPNYQLRRVRQGTIRGNRLFEPHGRDLAVTDLVSQKELVRYRTPPMADGHADVLDFHEHGDGMFVVTTRGSIREDAPRGPLRLQLDAFDRRTGAHRATQTLDGIVHWQLVRRIHGRDRLWRRTQLEWRGGALFGSDLRGLHAFIPATQGPRVRPLLRLAHRSRQPVTIDGQLNEWDDRAALALDGEGGGKLWLAHDSMQLRIALSLPDGAFTPRRGRGHAGGGDWVEVGLTAEKGSFRWGFGLDGHGRAVWESLGAGKLPDGLQGAVRHTARDGRLVYELSAPLKSLLWVDKIDRPHSLGLSLAVWQERPRRRRGRRFTWGGALEGRQMLAVAHRRVTLHPHTRDGFEAALAICGELPDLVESWRFLRESVLPLAGGPRGAVPDALSTLLAKAPKGLLAERLLPVFDQQLRTFSRPDPSGAVLKFTEAAGVPTAIRRRYARQARAYLSQWVHLDSKKPPATLFLRLNAEGLGSDSAVFWGRNSSRIEGRLGTRTRRYAGPLPDAGAWKELRVPLVWLDLHDRAITTLLFGQVGGGQVLWDRSAVVVDGKEHVFLDDEELAASSSRNWRWVSRPVKSGRRAHTHSPPRRHSDAAYHYVRELKAPIRHHLIPPIAGGIASTWVWVDPAKRPEYILFGVRDVGGHSHTAVWGGPRSGSRHRGPLPPPGRWTELRIHLATTDLHDKPIDGFLFGQKDGRAVWDRAALAAGGKTQVLVDDDVPPGASVHDHWQWVDQPVKSGKRAHTYKTDGRSGIHHVQFHANPAGRTIAPHTRRPPAEPVPALNANAPQAATESPLRGRRTAVRRARAIAFLKEQIPRLGPTEQAWRFFEEMLRLEPPTPELRILHLAWFVQELPQHPRIFELLRRFVSWHQAAKTEKPADVVYALAKAAGVPRKTLYQFRREFRVGPRLFLRTWQVIGPFPNPKSRGYAKVYPPEADGVRLDREYQGAAGRVRWKLHESKEGRIDFAKLFQPNENVVCYAACWLRSERAQRAVIELGSDDGFKLWLNGRFIAGERVDRAGAPAQNLIPVALRRGWNEVLVKIENGERDWELYFEIADRQGRSLLPRLEVATSRPVGRH